jgi:peptidoglycan/LPS O-acetylase OafA/YrhL
MSARNGPIDCLRGFSILAVLVTHNAMPAFGLSEPKFTTILTNGIYGVAIFFVISGFLITQTVIARFGSLASIRIDQFYVLRVGRIVPCLVAFVIIYYLLLVAGIPAFVPQDFSVFTGSVRALLNLQYNEYYLTTSNLPGIYPFTPLWSISIEETFYLLFPIVCFFAKSDKVAFAISLLVIAVGVSSRLGQGLIFHFWGAADLLALGCLCAICVDHMSAKLRARTGWPIILAGVLVIGYAYCFMRYYSYPAWGPTVAGMGAALVIVGSSLRPSVAIPGFQIGHFVAAPFKIMGRMSLELYVFHAMINQLTLFGGVSNIYARCLILLLICGLLEAFVFSPLNRHIRRFYFDRTGLAQARQSPARDLVLVPQISGAISPRMRRDR